MTELDIDRTELEANLAKISSSSSYFSIIQVFAVLESSIHLSRIAELIGKGKSTTSVHIDNLLDFDKPFIEIDKEKTLSKTRGSKKFYKLTDYAITALKYQNEVLKQRAENALKEFASIEEFEKFDNPEEFKKMVMQEAAGLIEDYGEKTVLNYFSLGGEINANIEKLAATQYVDFAKKAHKGESIDGIKLGGTFLSANMHLKVAKMAHLVKIKEEAFKFGKKMEELKKEIEKEIEEGLKSGDIIEDQVGLQNIYLSYTPIIKE